jgi:hypothetical protein
MDHGVTTVTEVPGQIVQPIQAALVEVENTFMANRERWPRPDWSAEYTEAFLRLREIYEYLETEMVRQDLTFRVEKDFHRLREYCLWLVRRIGREIFFRMELGMEREMRSQTSNGAYDIYLKLVEVQDLEQEFLGLNDMQLVEYITTGKLETYRDLSFPFLPQ